MCAASKMGGGGLRKDIGCAGPKRAPSWPHPSTKPTRSPPQGRRQPLPRGARRPGRRVGRRGGALPLPAGAAGRRPLMPVVQGHLACSAPSLPRGTAPMQISRPALPLPPPRSLPASLPTVPLDHALASSRSRVTNLGCGRPCWHRSQRKHTLSLCAARVGARSTQSTPIPNRHRKNNTKITTTPVRACVAGSHTNTQRGLGVRGGCRGAPGQLHSHLSHALGLPRQRFGYFRAQFGTLRDSPRGSAMDLCRPLL